MKILFMTNIKDNSKAGLFLSVANRTSNILNNYNIEGKSISLIDYETKFCKLIKKLFNKDICNVNSKYFVFNNIRYDYIYNKINIMDVILSKFSLKFKLKKMFNTLEGQIDLSNYNLIQAHWAYPVGYIAKMAKEKYGIPYVLTVHGSDIHTIPFKNKDIKKYTLEALEAANKVIFVSNKLLQTAKTFGYSGENAIVIPNGIDTEMFKIIDKKVAKEELGFRNSKVVGFVGNLVEVKRADKLSEIFKNISDIDKNIEFLVIGEGILKDQIIKSCKDKKIKVKFTGRVEPEKVSYYMNAMDIMILPSRNEGWPCVVLEANACGVPVVGSDMGGIPEAIGKNGLIIKDGVGFEKRFSEAVVKALNLEYNPSNLRDRALEFDWNKISSTEYSVYSVV